jgi:glutamate carboxypeptidase
LTFNVGIISGGSGANRVPHHAHAEVEMRAFDPASFDAGRTALVELEKEIIVKSQEDGFPARVEVRQVSEIPPWPINDGSERLFALWKEAAQSLGIEVVDQARGGVSDGNHICSHVPTLDGLGPCGDHAHCSERSADGSKDQEFVNRDSFVPAGAFSVAAICRLLNKAER